MPFNKFIANDSQFYCKNSSKVIVVIIFLIVLLFLLLIITIILFPHENYTNSAKAAEMSPCGD